MRQRVLKLGIPDVSLQVMDLNQSCFSEEIFDFLLLDVPCSGLGTLASNPDIKWRFRQKELCRLQDYQLGLLRSVFPLLKRGRELIYSTCSTEEEENEEVVSFLLEKYDNAKIQEIVLKIKRSKPITEFNNKKYHKDVDKCLRIWPQDNDTEGFFVARIKKS